jgi:hypothetical protein
MERLKPDQPYGSRLASPSLPSLSFLRVLKKAMEEETGPVGDVENPDDPLTISRFSPGCPKAGERVFPACELRG